jgi:hypothetical protein
MKEGRREREKFVSPFLYRSIPLSLYQVISCAAQPDAARFDNRQLTRQLWQQFLTG